MHLTAGQVHSLHTASGTESSPASDAHPTPGVPANRRNGGQGLAPGDNVSDATGKAGSTRCDAGERHSVTPGPHGGSSISAATDGAPNAARLVSALAPLLRGYGAANLASWEIRAEQDLHGRTWVVVRAPHPVSGEPGVVVNVFPPSLAVSEARDILRGDIAAWGRIARRKVVEDAYAAWEGGMAGVR
jgi:hypothetical protein